MGATLVRKLAAKGYDVKVANSRGPESLRELAQESGALAVTKEDAVKGVDVVILSLPFTSYAGLSGLFAKVPADVVVIDISNYYPFRDGEIGGVDNGTPESVWIRDQIGRPVVKAWTAALAATLADRGMPAGAGGRIALPVSGDDGAYKAIAMRLVEATGFDAVDAGARVDSWRQQPGMPAYCTELSREDLEAALAKADRARAPENREALIKEFMARYGELTHDDIIARNREGTA